MRDEGGMREFISIRRASPSAAAPSPVGVSGALAIAHVSTPTRPIPRAPRRPRRAPRTRARERPSPSHRRAECFFAHSFSSFGGVSLKSRASFCSPRAGFLTRDDGEGRVRAPVRHLRRGLPKPSRVRAGRVLPQGDRRRAVQSRGRACGHPRLSSRLAKTSKLSPPSFGARAKKRHRANRRFFIRDASSLTHSFEFERQAFSEISLTSPLPRIPPSLLPPQVSGPDGAYVQGALPRNANRQRFPYPLARGGGPHPGAYPPGMHAGYAMMPPGASEYMEYLGAPHMGGMAPYPGAMLGMLPGMIPPGMMPMGPMGGMGSGPGQGGVVPPPAAPGGGAGGRGRPRRRPRRPTERRRPGRERLRGRGWGREARGGAEPLVADDVARAAGGV